MLDKETAKRRVPHLFSFFKSTVEILKNGDIVIPGDKALNYTHNTKIDRFEDPLFRFKKGTPTNDLLTSYLGEPISIVSYLEDSSINPKEIHKLSVLNPETGDSLEFELIFTLNPKTEIIYSSSPSPFSSLKPEE